MNLDEINKMPGAESDRSLLIHFFNFNWYDRGWAVGGGRGLEGGGGRVEGNG